MPKKEIAVRTYPILLSQLKKVFIEGMQRIEEEKVRTYWRTGEIISNYILENKERADYGENLFDKLEKDLGIERSTLERTVKFYRTYPIVGTCPQLSWVHYRKLITVKDKAKRKLFEERAVEKEWSFQELSEAIRLDRLKIEEPCTRTVQGKPKAVLSVTRSRLYTYQVLEPSYIHPIEEYLTVDLGFNTLIHAEIKGLKLKAGELVESVPATKIGGSANYFGGKYSGYSFKHLDAKNKELYTYMALVERVIDGDTIWLNIDLGFSCWSRQKVRLRGIDCLELLTKKGLEAKAFVEAKLKEVSFVIVKTYKDDKYGRYLTDVFYSKDKSDFLVALEQGTYLNQELLDKGLARIWQAGARGE